MGASGRIAPSRRTCTVSGLPPEIAILRQVCAVEPTQIDTNPPSHLYWAFISYSSKDAQWGRWLHRAIETYGIPATLVGHATPAGHPAPRRFHPLFRDRDELPAAFDLSDHIEQALSQSRYLIVVCSPNAAQSQWVNREIETFQRLGRQGSILAIIVDGEPNSGDARECFPPALRDSEPLAADARPQSDGRTNAKLKLLAGMLGVSFDALKQRDSHRRIRRLQLVVATALLTAFSFAALAVYSNQQKIKAVAARKQAESVLEFLVYDLADKLAPVGRLDIVQDVQRQVDGYYRALGVDRSASTAVHNQAAAISYQSDRLLQQGDAANALKGYREALAISERLAADDPSDIHWQHSIAVSQGKIGDALAVEGDPVGALKAYRQAQAVHQRLAADYSNTVGWQRESSYLDNRIGTVLGNQGDLAAALEAYRQSVDRIRRLADADPADGSLQRDLAAGESRMAQVLLLQGDRTGALQIFRQALERLQRLVALGHPDAGWQHELSSVQGRIGDALMEQNDVAGALMAYRESLALREGLVASDPSNADWQLELAFCYGRLAKTLDGTGSSEALEWLRKTYDQFISMRRRGMAVPVDEVSLERLRVRAGR